MLITDFFIFKYARLILDNTDDKYEPGMERSYDYVHITSYYPLDLPNFRCQPKKTPIIDLTKNIDDIFSAFNSNTRNQIRKTEKSDLQIIPNDDNFQEAYDLHCRFERSQRRRPIPENEFKNSILFSAYFEGQLVSAIICYTDNKAIRINHLFSVRTKNNEKLLKNIAVGYATRRLIFEICKYGQSNRYEKFDLCIVNFNDQNKSGINQFKLSFGGDVWDTYIYRYRTKLFYLFNKIFKIR